MNSALNQSSCGSIPLPVDRAMFASGASLEALARRGRCLRSAAMFAAARTVAGFLRRGLRSLLRELSRQQVRRRSIAQLSRLDDRLLADIGIERGQIPSLVETMLERQSAAHTRAHRATQLGRLKTDATASIPSLGDPAANDDNCPPLAA